MLYRMRRAECRFRAERGASHPLQLEDVDRFIGRRCASDRQAAAQAIASAMLEKSTNELLEIRGDKDFRQDRDPCAGVEALTKHSPTAPIGNKVTVLRPVLVMGGLRHQLF